MASGTGVNLTFPARSALTSAIRSVWLCSSIVSSSAAIFSRETIKTTVRPLREMGTMPSASACLMNWDGHSATSLTVGTFFTAQNYPLCFYFQPQNGQIGRTTPRPRPDRSDGQPVRIGVRHAQKWTDGRTNCPLSLSGGRTGELSGLFGGQKVCQPPPMPRETRGSGKGGSGLAPVKGSFGPAITSHHPLGAQERIGRKGGEGPLQLRQVISQALYGGFWDGSHHRLGKLQAACLLKIRPRQHRLAQPGNARSAVAGRLAFRRLAGNLCDHEFAFTRHHSRRAENREVSRLFP